MMKSYDERVRAYEAEGMTRSDAQGIVDLEDLRAAQKAKATAHTPGPWDVVPFLTPYRDDDPMMVYHVCAGDLQDRFDNLPADGNEEQALDEIHAENAANARLIAAAPEMKDLLLHALHYIETPGDFTETERLELCQDIDDLIAKAEGRA